MGKFGSLSSSSSGSTTSSSSAPPAKPPSQTGTDRMIVSGTTGKAWKPVDLSTYTSSSSAPPSKRGGKKPVLEEQPDKASTDVSSSSESEKDQDVLRRILYEDSASHQTEEAEQEELTESMKMRAILYGSPGDNQSASSGWDSGAEGDGDKDDNSRSVTGSRSSRSGSVSHSQSHSSGGSRSGSVSRSRSQSSDGSGSRSRSISQSRSQTSGGSVSQSRSRSFGSRSNRSRSSGRSRFSRSPSNGETRSRSYSGGGSQSGSKSRSPSSRSRSDGSHSRSQSSRSRSHASQSRSKSSRSRSPSSSRSPSDPPESKGSQLHQSDNSHSEKESLPSHSGSLAMSSGSDAPPSQQSINMESNSGSKTSRSGSDPPESPRKVQSSPSQGSWPTSRTHPWHSTHSRSNRSGSVSRKSDVKISPHKTASGNSNRAISPTKSEKSAPKSDASLGSKSLSRRDEKPSSGRNGLQRLEEQRKTQANQDSSKNLEAAPRASDPVEDDKEAKESSERPPNSRVVDNKVVEDIQMEAAAVRKSVENDVAKKSPLRPIENDEKQASTEPITELALLEGSVRSKSENASESERDKEAHDAEPGDHLHKLVVHDNDDWKPPALTTYGEVRYIPSHQYESRKDPDALEPAGASVPPNKDADTPPKQSKKAQKDAPPPIPEITLIPSIDDDSTLGLHGEYLDRFPKKNQRNFHEVLNDSTPEIASVAKPVAQPQPQSIRHNTTQPVPPQMHQPALQPMAAHESTIQLQSQPVPQSAPKLKPALKATPPSEYEQYKLWVHENIARPKEKEAMDDYYKSWIRPESAGERKPDRSDPPADVNLFPFNPKNPLEVKHDQDDDLESSLQKSPMYASVNRAALRTSTWVPREKRDEDAVDSIPSVPQYFKSERSLNSTWAAPGTSKEGKKYDHEIESRRLYIESILAQKRTSSRDQSRVMSRPRQTSRVDFTGAVTSPSSSSKSSSFTSKSSSYSSASASALKEASSKSSSSPSSSQPSASTESMLRSEQSDASSNPRRTLAPTPLLGKTEDSETSHSIEVEDDSGTSHNIEEDSAPRSSKGDSQSSRGIEVVDVASSRLPAIAPDNRDEPINPMRENYAWPSDSQREPRKRLAPAVSRTTLLFLAVFCIIALAGIGVAVYFMVPQFRQGENPSPTTAPTPQSTLDASLEGLRDLIIEESPETEVAFEDPASPQSFALDWLSTNTFLASYSSDQVLQRFVMATLYFSTSGESWTEDDLWLSNISECEWYSSETEIQVCRPKGKLDELDLKRNNLVGTLPLDELAILKSQLVILDVFSNQISGSIGAGVGALTSLRALDLQDNRITGTIPRALRRLTNMRHLILADNSISGQIPGAISQMTKLVTLNLRRNSLTGNVPSTIGELSNLRYLLLDGNNLVGTIPGELCQMNLEKLVVDCDLVSCDCCMCGSGSAPSPSSPTQPPAQNPTGSPPTGSSPTAYTPTSGSNLLNLILEAFPESQEALQDLNSPQSRAFEWLESSANDGVSFQDKILQRYALAVLYYACDGNQWTNNDAWLTDIDECSWWSNANSQDVCDSLGRYLSVDLAENNLQGSIPAELAMLSNSVTIINLSTNDLSGSIPSVMFDATNLRQLSLFENNLVGSLASEVGQLTRLESLDIGGNQLTGSLPSSLGQMQRLAGLSIYKNLFTGTLPNALGDLDNLQLLYADSNQLRGPFPTDLCLLNLQEFWSDCEEIQCVCCTTCCSDNFGCVET